MADLVQVHVFIPRALKIRAFTLFVQREMKFSQWLRAALEAWVEAGEAEQQGPQDVARPRRA